MDFPAYARGVVASTRLSSHHAADLNVPIACADVAVYPGDILVGDGDGVTVIPRASRRRNGRPLRGAGRSSRTISCCASRPAKALYGVYPPNDQTRADYQAWQARARAAKTPRHCARSGSPMTLTSRQPIWRRRSAATSPPATPATTTRSFPASRRTPCTTFPPGLARDPVARRRHDRAASGSGASRTWDRSGPSRRSCARRRRPRP